MAARRWFTVENTSGLYTQDLSILNRAARYLQDRKHNKPLSHLELVILRTAYKPGMSANDLLEAANAE